MKKKRRKTMSRPQQIYGMGKTTGMVAEELENKYGLMEAFFNMEEDYIVNEFEKAYVKGIEDGVNLGTWDVKWNTDPVESKFRHAITGRRFDGILKGVPTKAAQRGVSHLRADPYKPSAERPSFMNTSLFMRSFKAWLEK
jgi:hypothetical protein